MAAQRSMKEPPAGAPQPDPIAGSTFKQTWITDAERRGGMISSAEFESQQTSTQQVQSPGSLEHLIDIIGAEIPIACRRCNPWDLLAEAQRLRHQAQDRLAHPEAHPESSAEMLYEFAYAFEAMSRGSGVDVEEELRKLCRTLETKFGTDAAIMSECSYMLVNYCRMLNGSHQVNTMLSKHNVIL